MAKWEEGQSGNPNGRPAGSQNKLTKTVRETVLNVFNELQEDAQHNLKSFAKENPKEFYQIASKLIPNEITGTVKTVINVLGGEVNDE